MREKTESLYRIATGLCYYSAVPSGMGSPKKSMYARGLQEWLRLQREREALRETRHEKGQSGSGSSKTPEAVQNGSSRSESSKTASDRPRQRRPFGFPRSAVDSLVKSTISSSSEPPHSDTRITSVPVPAKEENGNKSDSELSCEWNMDMRDAEYAAKLRKTNTKSSRRRDTRFLNPTQVNMRLQILADQGVNVDWDAIDDPTVHFNHLCQEPTAPAYPRFIAKFMDVCRVPIGERFVVDLLSYEEKEGVFACHWGKIRSDLAEFERQANGNPTVPGIDAWNTFPGDVVELQEVNSDIYRRGVVIECFKRAKQVDIKMVEYGNHVIRAGTERVRRVWSNLHKELRWRVFFVCFFRPQASLSPEDLRAIQELLPRENVEAEVRCVRYQGRVCIGEMLITRLGLRESL